MSRVLTAFATVMGVALAGCSSSPFSMPDWLSPRPSPPPLQTLKFESEPPDADVRSAHGETCQTPCSLAVPSESQSVTFEKKGFMSQTVRVSVGAPPEHSVFSKGPPPTLIPNPVKVTLEPVAPPRKRAGKPRHAASHAQQPTGSPSPPPFQVAGAPR